MNNRFKDKSVNEFKDGFNKTAGFAMALMNRAYCGVAYIEKIERERLVTNGVRYGIRIVAREGVRLEDFDRPTRPFLGEDMNLHESVVIAVLRDMPSEMTFDYAERQMLRWAEIADKAKKRESAR